jgi:hypothetical protein
MPKKKDPRHHLVRRLTINMTSPEYNALKAMAKAWDEDSPRAYLQKYVREELLEHRLAVADRSIKKC